MPSHGKSLMMALLLLGLILLLAKTSDGAPEQGCDKSRCRGPLRFYEDLNCRPVYEAGDKCCAARYDCSHLEGRAADKCHVNNRTYAIGEELRSEDRASSCDIACKCVMGYHDVASFVCAAVDCPYIEPKMGCYLRPKPDSCCISDEVCPDDNDETLVKCEFNGTTYHDGQKFYPENNLVCRCARGYEGKNVAPFCRPARCGVELHHAVEISKRCTPVFYEDQSPQTDCSVNYRCQSDEDTLANNGIANKSATDPAKDDMKCTFGNLKIKVGEKLKPFVDHGPACVQCVCEVPPTLTCQRFPIAQCDVAQHPSLDL